VTSEPVPQLLTLAAVSKALCVSTHTVRAWVRKGKLRPSRICRRLLFHPDEVVRFLTASKAEADDVVSVVTFSEGHTGDTGERPRSNE
jgi:predicted site-specific integrase-resolvase